MTALTIAVAEDAVARLRSAVATFPRSFRATRSASPDVSVIGGGAGWAQRARSVIDDGVRAVLVGDPGIEDVGELLGSARHAGASVLLAPAGAEDPALVPTRERLAASDGDLLECRVIASPTGSRSATVVALLTLLGRVASPLRHLDTASGDEHGLHATGRLESGRDVLLTVDLSAAVRPVARLRLISSTGILDVDIPLSERSRPARLREISGHGEWHAEADYLGSSRAALARLHATATGRPDVSDLEAFERQLSLARELP